MSATCPTCYSSLPPELHPCDGVDCLHPGCNAGQLADVDLAAADRIADRIADKLGSALVIAPELAKLLAAAPDHWELCRAFTNLHTTEGFLELELLGRIKPGGRLELELRYNGGREAWRGTLHA